MDYLTEDFEKLGLSVFAHNGLLEVHGDDRYKAILCAHLDRHGLISLGDNEYGFAAQYIREVKYGENNKGSREEVDRLSKRFEGEYVYAYHPHNGEVLAEGSILACYPHMRNDDALFYVSDIPMLEQNIPLAYSKEAQYQDGYLKGQIDNAVSIALVYELFKNGFNGTALFSTDEEIGKSWIHITNYLQGMRLQTESLLIIDTSPYVDENIIEQGYVIFRNRDKSEVFNLSLIEEFKTRCDKLGIPYQIKDEYLLAQGKTVEQLGSTELGRIIQNSGGYWSGTTVQIPTLEYHTSNETTTDDAVTNIYRFLHNILLDDYILLLKARNYREG